MKYVYFAQNKETGLVKIGCSERPDLRIRQLSREGAASIAMLGMLPGGFRSEHALHKTFAGCRVRGEWFSPTSELLAFAATLPPPEPAPGHALVDAPPWAPSRCHANDIWPVEPAKEDVR